MPSTRYRAFSVAVLFLLLGTEIAVDSVGRYHGVLDCLRPSIPCLRLEYSTDFSLHQ